MTVLSTLFIQAILKVNASEAFSQAMTMTTIGIENKVVKVPIYFFMKDKVITPSNSS